MKSELLMLNILMSAIFFTVSADQAASLPTGNDLYYGELSENLIIRWGFQELCDHVFDPRTGVKDQPTTLTPGGVTFDPKDVKPGDVIFVRKPHVFMQEMHEKITSPYIIVTHGDFLDTCREEDIKILNDEKIIAWFSIHPPKCFHKKFYPIPLGILQKKEHFLEKERLSKTFLDLRNKPKQHLLAVTFSDTEEQNPERAALAKTLVDKTYCYNPGETKFQEYLEALALCKFALSPRGWGPDCYRTWESLLVGTIPVVKRGQFDVMEHAKEYLRTPSCYGSSHGILCNLDQLYKDLPVLVIDDWNEITEEFLEEKYKEITSRKYDIKKLSMEYWREIIENVKIDFLETFIVRSAHEGPVNNVSKHSNVQPDQSAHLSNKATFTQSLWRGFKSFCNYFTSSASQKTKLKILVVTGTFPRLSESFVLNQIIGLINQGHDVTIFAEKSEMEKVHDNVYKYDLLSQVYYNRLPEDIATYDIALCQYGTCGVDFLELKKKHALPCKLVTFFRGYDITQYAFDNPGCFDELFIQGDYYMANCEHFKQKAIRLGCDPEKICVTFSPIDLSIFTYQKKSFDFSKNVHLISAGRLIEKKGLEDALMAVGDLILDDRSIHYTIAGDGPLRGILEEKVQEMGIQENVHFVGAYTSNTLAELFKDAHIFIGPSVTASDKSEDACPNVLKEAMASGLPVVATRHGGIPEIITDGENGMLIAERDIVGLQLKVRALVNNPNLCAQLARAARITVEKYFDVDVIGRSLSASLIRIAQSNSSPLIAANGMLHTKNEYVN